MFFSKGTTDYEWVADDLPYTTLMFTIGEAANYTWNGHQVTAWIGGFIGHRWMSIQK